jgi:hypothetical protein
MMARSLVDFGSDDAIAVESYNMYVSLIVDDARVRPALVKTVLQLGLRLLSAFSNSSTFRIRPPTYVPVERQDSFAIVVVEKNFAASKAPGS